MELQLPKGTRDFAQETLRDRIVAALKETFSFMGLSVGSMIFERYEVLASKYAGGLKSKNLQAERPGQQRLGIKIRFDCAFGKIIG